MANRFQSALANNYNVTEWHAQEGDIVTYTIEPSKRHPYTQTVSFRQVRAYALQETDTAEYIERLCWGLTARGGGRFTNHRNPDGTLVLDPSLIAMRAEQLWVCNATPQELAASTYGSTDPELVCALLGQLACRTRAQLEAEPLHPQVNFSAWAGMTPETLLAAELKAGEGGQG